MNKEDLHKIRASIKSLLNAIKIAAFVTIIIANALDIASHRQNLEKFGLIIIGEAGKLS